MGNHNEINLYAIINSLTELNAPILIKGGNALGAALKESNSPIYRLTTDIDGNWTESNPNIFAMQEILEEAVQRVYPDYHVILKRDYGPRRSAGFTIVDPENTTVSRFDIDVNKPSNNETEYSIYGISFYGVPIEDMLADKITVLSSKNIFRRSKDLLDVYAITNYINYDKNTLIENLSNKQLGNFEELFHREQDLNHAYNKMTGVENKPCFEDVYNYVTVFCNKLKNDLQRQTSKNLDNLDNSKTKCR